MTTPTELEAAVERVTAKLAEIVSDDEIAKVHGHANFGEMTPREVVNDGVRKTAVGYHCGHTQFTILREHGLITRPPVGSYDANLTKKGKAYARVLYHAGDTAALESALAEANERASLLQTAVHERCAERDEARADLSRTQELLKDIAAERAQAITDRLLARDRAEVAEAALAASEARREALEGQLAVVRQSLKEQAEARRDPAMPVLVPSVLEAIRADAEAQWACAEDKHDRINAHGLMLLCEWQERALNPQQEGSRDHG